MDLSDVRKVCVTVIMFMEVTVLLTHPDAMTSKVACQSITWQNVFLSVFLNSSFMHLLDHFCALFRCKRIGVQLQVG